MNLLPEFVSRYDLGDLRFEEVRYPSGIRRPEHAHPEAFLDLCLEGTVQEVWGRRTFARGSSTLNFLPIGAPHASSFPEDARTFQIVLKGTWLERLRPVFASIDTPISYRNGLPNYLARRIYQEFQRRDDLTPMALEGMMLDLLAEMARHTRDRNIGNVAGSDCPRWLSQVKDLLHAHFTEIISVKAIAAAVGVHPSHLMRGFRQRYGCTAGDYIRRLRVEYACHLLSTSDDPPSQIALSAGFSDQSHFSRTFKEHTGMTPTTFRKAAGRAILR